MSNLIEAVPGTSSLLPIVLVLISNNEFTKIFPWQNIFAIAALLVFPVGWLALQVEGFILTFLWGRYENEPPMKHLRHSIEVEDKGNGKYTVYLDKVLPASYPNKVIHCQCQQEFDKLFDPFKILKYLPLSYRKKQEKKKEIPPYVENIENILFFKEEAYSSYIREVVKYWHISLASALGFIYGLIIAFGIFLIFNGFGVYGWAVIVTFVIILLTIAGIQSHFRKKEAIANEYLLLKLKVPTKTEVN